MVAYRGKNAINILLKLCIHECNNVSEAATILLDILEGYAVVYFNNFKDERVIIEVLNGYINNIKNSLNNFKQLRSHDTIHFIY